MTSNDKLLPLPEYLYGREASDNERVVTVADAHAYAVRNVAHATAAKDAEIEALRAEVSGLRAARIGYASEFPPTEDGDPDVGNIHANIRAMKARVERLAEEIDWIKSQPEDDRMFAEIEAAAKASFHRHRTSCRGQVLTRADNYESHLVWSALEWAKRTNGAEQHANRLAEALRGLKDLMLGQVKWEPCDCGCPQKRTPDGPHSVTWLRAAQQVEIAISKAEGKE